MKKNRQNKKGFTLMELVVVIAILAVLGLMLYPQITKYLDNAKITTAEANARTAYTAALFESSTAADPTAIDEADIKEYFSNKEDTSIEISNISCTGVGECTVTVKTNSYSSTCDKTGCTAATK